MSEDAYIPIYDRDGNIKAHIRLDAADAQKYGKWKWTLRSGYAVRTDSGHSVSLHRLILGLERGDPRQVDHINGNRLDNRRANIRVVTARIQQQNRPKRAGTLSKY